MLWIFSFSLKCYHSWFFPVLRIPHSTVWKQPWTNNCIFANAHKCVHLHLHPTERTQIINKPFIFFSSVIPWFSFNLKSFQNRKLNSLRVSATVLLGGKKTVVLEICEKISHQPPGLEIRINSLNPNRLLLNWETTHFRKYVSVALVRDRKYFLLLPRQSVITNTPE